MENQPANTEVDPQVLRDARNLWHNFMGWMTYGVIGVAVLLALLAALFV